MQLPGGTAINKIILLALQQRVWLHREALQLCTRQVVLGVGQL
jgi:hypothetical protein